MNDEWKKRAVAVAGRAIARKAVKPNKKQTECTIDEVVMTRPLGIGICSCEK